MSQDKTWYEADSESEQIHILVERALREFNNNIDLLDIYSRADEIDNIEDKYDRNTLYGTPYTDMTTFDIEDKPIPRDSAGLIKQSDTLYIGIARAAKAGMEELEKRSMSLDEYPPDEFVNFLIGIVKSLAARIERKPWSVERDGVFFNDPTFITTVE